MWFLVIVLFCLTTWATEEFICEEKVFVYPTERDFNVSNFLRNLMADDSLPVPYPVKWEIYQKPYNHADTHDSDDFDE